MLRVACLSLGGLRLGSVATADQHSGAGRGPQAPRCGYRRVPL